jgi:hypothetical protein
MKMYALVSSIVLAACGGKKDEPAASPGSATPVAAVADAAAGGGEGSAAGSAADLDVPTEVDFEELATTEITEKNVEAQVKAIEQELAQ